MTMIEKIREYHKIQTLAAQACNGLNQSDRAGRYFLGWCPFCQQSTKPGERKKFWIDIEMQICNCFKAKCRQSRPMDVINFYARLHGINNQAAIAELWLEYNLRTAK